MKQLFHSLLFFLIILFQNHLYALTLSDDFENGSVNGWTNTQGVISPGGDIPTRVLELKNNTTNYKFYSFGASFANKPVQISIDFFGKEQIWNSFDPLTVYVYDTNTSSWKTLFTFPTTNATPISNTYDYNTTTDNRGNALIAIFPATRDTLKTLYIDNIKVTLLIDDNFKGRPFTERYKQTLYGNMTTIGNTILVTPSNQSNDVCDSYTNGTYLSNATNSNDSYELCAYYADNSVSFPTTKARLEIPSTIKSIKWVGLYWQALVKKNEDLSNMAVRIKHSNATEYSAPFGADVLDSYTSTLTPDYTNYSAFKDVTAYFRDNNYTTGDVTVGNIPVVEGKIDTIGTYGAWTLVYIYEDTNATLKNFAVYDGWEQLGPLNNQIDITVSGFFTPKNPPNGIKSNLSVFVAEGDKKISQDSLEAQNQTISNLFYTTLSTNFDSSITPATLTRTPNPTNNQGIDIRNYELGTNGYDILNKGQSEITFRFKSLQDTSFLSNVAYDRYFPSMIAFAADVYTPEICYDYTVSIGDSIPVDAPNRDINTSSYGIDVLKIQFLIRSEEADFNYINSKARIKFVNPNRTLTYNENYSEMSPPNTNIYYTYTGAAPLGGHTEIESNRSIGQIAIGGGVIGNTSNDGGELLPNEITYGKLGYDIAPSTEADPRLITHFDLYFNTTINFGTPANPSYVDFEFNTATTDRDSPSYIPRCATNVAYDPVVVGFNVERANCSSPGSAQCSSLPTQIVDRNYTVDIIAYQGGVNNTGSNTLLDEDFNGTLEIEIIDADNFDNNSSVGYDVTCETPKAKGEGVLVDFPNVNGTGKLTISPVDLNLAPRLAIRNAAFRLWIISYKDANNTKQAVLHDCTNKTDDNCFEKVYQTIKGETNTTLCDSECITNKTGTCYLCLKNLFATPICSRDNFSIRPQSFYIEISDDNQKNHNITPIDLANNTQNTTGTNAINVAAGYDYHIAINATTFQGSNIRALGYFSDSEYVYRDDIQTLNSSSSTFAALEFADNATCYDTNHSTFALTFADGTLTGDTHFRYENAGRYTLWLNDSNWTLVDHQDYPLKPFPNEKDCEDNITTPSSANLVPCTFTSTEGILQKIEAEVHPYRFSVSNISVVQRPADANYTYYNDFTDPYYANLTTNPIRTSVSYIGNIIARPANLVTGKTRLSNFTKGCAATDLLIDTNITVSPTTVDTDSISPLQRYLQCTSEVNTTCNTQTSGLNATITLTKEGFPDTIVSSGTTTINPGEARILLHTTFQKPKDDPIDPIIASYIDINVSAPDASHTADLQSGRVPTGRQTYNDINMTYYFAKITPERIVYEDVKESSILTPIYVDVYCSYSPSECNSTYNLTTTTKGKEEDNLVWYSATMFDSTQDGLTDLAVSTLFGEAASPQIAINNGTPNNRVTDVAFDDTDSSQKDVNISLSGSGRPSTVDISIEPQGPWLRFNPDDPNGYPHYRVKFIGDSTWSGVGNTGFTTEATANDNANSSRLNW